MVIAGDIRANNWVAPGSSQAVRMIINAWPEFSQMRRKYKPSSRWTLSGFGGISVLDPDSFEKRTHLFVFGKILNLINLNNKRI